MGTPWMLLRDSTRGMAGVIPLPLLDRFDLVAVYPVPDVS